MPLPPRLFCDTSYFYACFDRSDINHQGARALAVEAAASSAILCTTWDVISETITLLRYRRGFREALAFLTEIRPQLHVVNYGESVRKEAEQIFRRYGRDHRLSFCDAISFVVVSALLEHIPCLAFDEDFRTLGLSVIP
jgi:predicted nucleic acid-binding protein